MRHLGTLIAAVVTAPLVWILLAAGQDRSLRAFAAAQDGAELTGGDFLRPVLVLAAAGILLGLIGTLRYSPLGATVAGAAYAASYLGLLVSPSRALDVVDHTLSVAGHRIELAAPVRSGTTLLLGALLLVSVASVQRWRRWPRPTADEFPVVVPDEIIPPMKGQDRPLGADGLGLGKRDGAGERDDLPAEPEPAMAGTRHWSTTRSNQAAPDPQGWSQTTREW
ncbi:hypothetical protein SAMN05444365_10411 [Micromonospora pattaloongensis]|uniref:Tryptophan-associated transmembrane protein (Trp_oprn_chp) n=1 Tax=Micromonospora pattaloongensis TaxID=405436 RepID=A0A1H3NII5_9ACTN|nr:hypothetical protein [Micromonospora pattaloongensis]SDY88692.1 hypothetical protein SAMN05444365_10411 [Micromonospora pattaloongensis]